MSEITKSEDSPAAEAGDVLSQLGLNDRPEAPSVEVEGNNGDSIQNKKSIRDRISAAAVFLKRRSTPSQVISSWISSYKFSRFAKKAHRKNRSASASSGCSTSSWKCAQAENMRRFSLDSADELMAAANALAEIQLKAVEGAEYSPGQLKKLFPSVTFRRSLSTSSTSFMSTFSLSPEDGDSMPLLPLALKKATLGIKFEPIVEGHSPTPEDQCRSSGGVLESFEQKICKLSNSATDGSHKQENNHSAGNYEFHRKVLLCKGGRTVEKSSTAKTDEGGKNNEQSSGDPSEGLTTRRPSFHSLVSVRESRSVIIHHAALNDPDSQQHDVTQPGTLRITSDKERMLSVKSGHPSGALDLAASEITVHKELDKIKIADSRIGQVGQAEVQTAMDFAGKAMTMYIRKLESAEGVLCCDKSATLNLLDKMFKLVIKAWSIDTHGHSIGTFLCSILRNEGGLEVLIKYCESSEEAVVLSAIKVLEQSMTFENRPYVALQACNGQGLRKVMNAIAKNPFTPIIPQKQDLPLQVYEDEKILEFSRARTGLLGRFFKVSDETCEEIVKMGGLDVILTECCKTDIAILRHCALALANLSLYGGPENQLVMIQKNVPTWLFHLAFHYDDIVQYYACLAVTALVANKEIQAEVIKSGTLELVEPFITTHTPNEFAKVAVPNAHGQCKAWLQRLVPLLLSKRHEARALAAFHFAMEAGIKKKQGQTDIFKEIKAVEALKVVASSPVAIASRYAAQALRFIGEEVPHKLSLQVPAWSTEDVKQWVELMGFAAYAQFFEESRVDGDLLLQMTEEMLKDDAGMKSSLLRKRFMRELLNLKEIADYSSCCDTSNINSFLQEISSVLSQYTYQMIKAGVDTMALKMITDEDLANDCRINNSIHRKKILEAVKNNASDLASTTFNGVARNLDVFISYRRSNGSQLASLLKVHMEVKGFSAFLDVERLEAGKFDNNLLRSIQQAKNFFLVLTPNALDRCIGDEARKDWVHKEVCCALESGCNIIPIMCNFQWPEPEQLPEDMRAVCYFNGVRWIHDYQDACVDKLVRFMNAETTLFGSSISCTARASGDRATPDISSTK